MSFNCVPKTIKFVKLWYAMYIFLFSFESVFKFVKTLHAPCYATYFVTMKNAKLFQIVILVPRFKYCEFLLSRSSTRKCWTGFWLRQKCGRLAFTTPWQQRQRRSCKISSTKFLVNHLSALTLTLIGSRGLLIGEKSDSNEGTLILTAMKISRRITKQKGDWK